MNCRWFRLACVGWVLVGLTGCVLPPPLPPPPPPLVALPGPGKTEAQFQADDATCRVAADAAPPSGEIISVPAPYQAPAQAGAPPTTPAQTGAVAAAPQQVLQITPGMVYLHCMTSHGEVVQPLPTAPPLYYGFYQAYPVYYGFGDTYPWLYGDYAGFGFFGGFGPGFGFGGYRGRFGYGGYRHGFGYRGYRGGFHGGGFHGGGFHGGGRP